ncbi:ABC-type oligopeptide transport system, periplasmic component [Methylacidimicrobium sp. AP8]|uniref:peptide ABC transporter substrate-binding protein n=1 Tax=Methylacidimicrobium sp. AP8 TaxID=2730359 RepID=UPI0018C195BF|nr:peptide ABC transporter substrate-binding protein [Methylacidimicrobium sp. AP8]CAB4243476.1 ABC-type oligopeptide transport system, periplasmic component [Methylacidimicrobium sp. AP8]
MASRSLPAFVCGIALVLLANCSRPSGSDRLTLINGPEPESLDPQVITGQPEGRICKALFEGLTAEDKDGNIVPGIAREWTVSPDGRTYRFLLRESCWSDGSPLTAADFVASWQRALAPEMAAKYADLLYFIENAEAYNRGWLHDFSKVGVRAIDAHTLEVRLIGPTPFFPALCAQPIYFPVPLAAIQKHGDNWIKPGKLVSNGPYLLESWRINDRIVLRKNPRYWRQETVCIPWIEALAVTRASAAFNLYASGKADLLLDKGLIPTFFLSELRKQPYFHSAPFLATYFYRINVTVPPLNDPRVRKALALSIDRERLIRTITRGGELPARSLTPPGIPGYTPPAGLEFDPDKARALLAEAGFPGGRGFPPLTLLYNSSEQNEQIATEIQALWRQILGISVSLRNQEWKVYLNSVQSLSYEIARSSWVGDYADPYTFLGCFLRGSGNNNTGWSNSRYEQLLAEATVTVDLKRRLALLHEAETILVNEELPILPIYFYSGIMLYDENRLGGIACNLLDEHPFREIYFRPRSAAGAVQR